MLQVPTSILCRAADLQWQPVREKGGLLRFEMKASDGGAQKLGNAVWHNSDSIATKVCSQFRWIFFSPTSRKVLPTFQTFLSVTDFKRIETPHNLCCDFGGYKTFTTCWSGCRVQVSAQVWAPAGHLAISPKAVPEGNRRFRGQKSAKSTAKLLGQLSYLLVWVGLASVKTGHFQVGGIRCWQRPACLRKICYHSWDTDTVQDSTRFNAL